MRANSFYEPHERPLAEICTLLMAVIEVEGPIHRDEIARRYTTAHGKSRVGNRIEEVVLRALVRMKAQGQIRQGAITDILRLLASSASSEAQKLARECVAKDYKGC